jgi:hypothetical protein
MAAFSGWRIDIFEGTGFTEITSFVQGFITTSKIEIGRPSTLNAVLTLDNDEGDFTPAEGGGTGTYASTNWLTVGIRITQQTNPDTTLSFIGIITDFKIVDNGTNSTVQIIANDWLNVAAGEAANITESLTGTDPTQIINDLLNGIVGAGVVFPNFGQSGASLTPVQSYAAAGVNWNVGRAAASSVTAIDYIVVDILAAIPAIMIPSSITTNTFPATAIYFNYEYFTRSITRKTAERYEFDFSESPTGTTLPFVNIAPGFDFDGLTTIAEVQSGITGVTSQTSTSGTSSSYGTRSRYYSGTGNLYESDFDVYGGALQVAEFWTKRQADTRYVPRQLTTSVELIEDRNSTAAATPTANLLSIKGVWQPCAITYTPTAGSQVTANCVISGRTIQAVPGRTTITLDLLPAQDYQSFVLNSSTLGVLDTNRLG